MKEVLESTWKELFREIEAKNALRVHLQDVWVRFAASGGPMGANGADSMLYEYANKLINGFFTDVVEYVFKFKERQVACGVKKKNEKPSSGTE
jgi:hypothetical protein